MRSVEPIRWTPEGVVMLDQRRLPGEVVYHTYTDYRDVAKAIKDMVIRGAPAIGVAAAWAWPSASNVGAQTLAELRAEFAVICETLARTRPTAVDLFWAIERFKRRFEELAAAAATDGAAGLVRHSQALVEEAQELHQERREADERIGRFGAELLPQKRPRDDAVQRRRAGHGRNRHGARRDSHGRRSRRSESKCWCPRRGLTCRARGSPPGSCIRTDSADADHRQHGRPFPENRR